MFALTEGVVLTHVLTTREIESGLVEAELDFLLWTLIADVGVPFAAGGEVDLDVHDGALALRGPKGWLAGLEPDAIIALRLHEGAFVLTEVDDHDLSLDDPGVAEQIEIIAHAAHSALAAFMFLRRKRPSLFSTPATPLLTLLTDALAWQPDLLRRPGLPLSTILATQALECREGEVALAGAPWEPGEANELSDDEILHRVRAARFLQYVRLSPNLIDDRAGEFFGAMCHDPVAVYHR